MPITLNRSAAIVLLSWAGWAHAQTGQSLIANPLLSPDKAKEMRRQIVEAAHKELVPPPPPEPTPAPTPAPRLPIGAMAGMPPGMMAPNGAAMLPGGMPGMPSMPGMMPGMPNGEAARQSLSRLQIVTVVGDTAILSLPAPVARGMPAPVSGMPGPGGSASMGPPPQPADESATRRLSTVTVRNGQRAFVEGVEVMANVRGDIVQLTLASMPATTVYQGGMQPAAYSPTTAVSMAQRERPSPEYANKNKPEPTSMSGAGIAGGLPVMAPFPQPGMPATGVAPRTVGF